MAKPPSVGTIINVIKKGLGFFSGSAPVAINTVKKSRVLTNEELEAIARQAAEATQRMLERWRGQGLY